MRKNYYLTWEGTDAAFYFIILLRCFTKTSTLQPATDGKLGYAGFEERFQKEAGLCSSAVRPALVKVVYFITRLPFALDFLKTQGLRLKRSLFGISVICHYSLFRSFVFNGLGIIGLMFGFIKGFENVHNIYVVWFAIGIFSVFCLCLLHFLSCKHTLWVFVWTIGMFICFDKSIRLY